jgi:hypothetical protein
VQFATQWLKAQGHPVVVMPERRAPKHEKWQEYSDLGDLYIQQRVEVKRLSKVFSGGKDWPFGKHFMVCSKHSFDRAFPKPYLYIILSKDMRCGGVVHSRTSATWRTDYRWDSRFNSRQLFYFSPLENVVWIKL